MALATRVLGRTGLRLPLLGFGAAPLGGVYQQWGDPQKAVDRAVDLGAGYFDTSPYYGNSEEVLGCLLAGKARDSFHVSTKVGRLSEDKVDFSPDWIERSVARSLRRLRVSYVDILLLHDVEFANSWNEVAEYSIPALQRIKERGWTRSIGFSCYPLSTAKQLITGPNSALVDLVLLYGHNNLIDNTLLDFSKELADKEIGVIDASPLGLGLLTDRGPPEWHAAPPEVKKICSKLSSKLKAGGKSLQEVALRYAFRNTPGASLLVGMSSAEEVEANVALVNDVMGRDNKEERTDEEMVISELKQFSGMNFS